MLFNEVKEVNEGPVKVEQMADEKAQEPEVLDATPVGLETLGESQPDEFKEELWDILGHAGITKKRILVFLIFMAAVIAGVFFIFSSGGSGLVCVSRTITSC